jgi:hypothetical protein
MMRRADVFFYGLFMDRELLRAKGLDPRDAEIAAVDDFALRIGQRATLVPADGARVYGIVMSLTLAELNRLYAEPGLEAYQPQAVLAQFTNDDVVAALCYNLPQPPAASERNPDYAARLRAVAEKVGLPEDYVASIQ